MEKQLLEYIKKGIEEEVKKEFDLSMIKLNEKKNGICAGILLNVMKYIEINRIGENLTFTIKEIK